MPSDQKKHEHPKWSYNANIYEVNLRQYTPEGTFQAFESHLPRLKDMGIQLLWFMPITPISEKGRLGTLGSYYAAKTYVKTNPEYGSIEDFKKLVKAVHDLEMKVIIDWVANHTGNDHHWLTEHPDYFNYDESNEPIHPHGWNDVSELNYANDDLRKDMVDAMQFWIDECDIDGYRCDMAHLVPLDFWVDAKNKLRKEKKDLFWLGECEHPEYHEVFDATYTWRWMHASEDFYHGKMSLQSMISVLYKSAVEFPCSAIRVYFTSNHDENSWNGTEYEKYGEAAMAFAILSCTWDGMPMLYSGQEMPNKRRLQFFEKDHIEWDGKLHLHEFYKTLLTLHATNNALRAGDPGALTRIISQPDDQRIFSYLRKNGDHEVLVILNLSGHSKSFPVKDLKGTFRNVFGGDDINFEITDHLDLHSWGYLVFEKINILKDR
ncbi:alpha-amylase family glycosyl hydrolase [soil metagenome]